MRRVRVLRPPPPAPPLLEAADEVLGVVRVERGVLARALLAAPPPGVPEDVHIWRPECERCLAHVGRDARLGADGGAHGAQQRAVERAHGGDRGRKGGGALDGGRLRPAAVAAHLVAAGVDVGDGVRAGGPRGVGHVRALGHAVQRLRPPVVVRDVQRRHAVRLVREQVAQLRRGYAVDEVGDARFRVLGGVAGGRPAQWRQRTRQGERVRPQQPGRRALRGRQRPQ